MPKLIDATNEFMQVFQNNQNRMVAMHAHFKNIVQTSKEKKLFSPEEIGILEALEKATDELSSIKLNREEYSKLKTDDERAKYCLQVYKELEARQKAYTDLVTLFIQTALESTLLADVEKKFPNARLNLNAELFAAQRMVTSFSDIGRDIVKYLPDDNPDKAAIAVYVAKKDGDRILKESPITQIARSANEHSKDFTTLRQAPDKIVAQSNEIKKLDAQRNMLVKGYMPVVDIASGKVSKGVKITPEQAQEEMQKLRDKAKTMNDFVKSTSEALERVQKVSPSVHAYHERTINEALKKSKLSQQVQKFEDAVVKDMKQLSKKTHEPVKPSRPAPQAQTPEPMKSAQATPKADVIQTQSGPMHVPPAPSKQAPTRSSVSPPEVTTPSPAKPSTPPPTVASNQGPTVDQELRKLRVLTQNFMMMSLTAVTPQEVKRLNGLREDIRNQQELLVYASRNLNPEKLAEVQRAQKFSSDLLDDKTKFNSQLQQLTNANHAVTKAGKAFTEAMQEFHLAKAQGLNPRSEEAKALAAKITTTFRALEKANTEFTKMLDLCKDQATYGAENTKFNLATQVPKPGGKEGETIDYFQERKSAYNQARQVLPQIAPPKPDAPRPSMPLNPKGSVQYGQLPPDKSNIVYSTLPNMGGQPSQTPSAKQAKPLPTPPAKPSVSIEAHKATGPTRTYMQAKIDAPLATSAESLNKLYDAFQKHAKEADPHAVPRVVGVSGHDKRAMFLDKKHMSSGRASELSFVPDMKTPVVIHLSERGLSVETTGNVSKESQAKAIAVAAKMMVDVYGPKVDFKVEGTDQVLKLAASVALKEAREAKVKPPEPEPEHGAKFN